MHSSRRRSVPTAIYDYAVIRAVPRVEREEFVNVGEIVSCQSTGLLEAGIELDPPRLRALDPPVALDAQRAHLAATATVCRRGPLPRSPAPPPTPTRLPCRSTRCLSILLISAVHHARREFSRSSLL